MTIFKKGELVSVTDSRKGQYFGICLDEFDTDNPECEWYHIRVATIAEGGDGKPVYGLNNDWYPGDDIPCRKGLAKVNKLEGRK